MRSTGMNRQAPGRDPGAAGGLLTGRSGAPGLVPRATMVDRRKCLHREQVEWHPPVGPPFLPAAGPAAIAVEPMAVERVPVAALALRALWAEVAARLGPHERTA